MVNYRRVVCEVALLGAFVALAAAAPTPDCSQNTHYDQRQNGTENYRLNIDGVVVAVAPAESIFSALGDMDDIMELLSLDDLNADFKPKPPQSSSSPAPAIQIVPVSVVGEVPMPKPEEKPVVGKPQEGKPEAEKPQEEKPEVPTKPAELTPLSDVSLGDDLKIQRKEVSLKKQEKANRLKNRLASFLVPLLRKARHH